jgi:hypothetical protein
MFVALLALVIAMSGSAYAIQQTRNGDNLITKRTLSGNRLRLNTVTGNEIANLQWHRIALINGWQNYNNNRAPAWAIDAQGIVHFRGAIESGSVAQFATLPPAVRPASAIYVSTNMTSSAVGRIEIDPGGEAYVEAPGGLNLAQDFTSLDGVSYVAH